MTVHHLTDEVLPKLVYVRKHFLRLRFRNCLNIYIYLYVKAQHYLFINYK